VDGWVWGRGALDMKGGVAMMACALLRCIDEGSPPAGDVVLACLSDEEAGGFFGAQFLVERHPELFDGVCHAIGEGGGVSQQLAGRTFYPIMVAEKRACRLRITLRGPGGHASRSHRGGTMARLGSLLTTLDRTRLPVRLTRVAELFIKGLADNVAGPQRARLLALLDPARADTALDGLGADAVSFDAILHNTINATIVRAGQKINVIPSSAVVETDGRVLPGVLADEFVAEVRAAIGAGPEIEVIHEGPVMPDPEVGAFYHLLEDVLRDMEPAAIAVPFLLSGATDQRHFARLGISGCGFLPLKLPAGVEWQTVHSADERVPGASLDFGAEALFQVLQRYRG
jgi:acetylornithine deacetylase/succinyl-diaminopimelate desuccinylase-like protein